MLPEFISARMPTFVQSMGISLAIAIVKKIYSPTYFVTMLMIVFNTLWLLQIYAPLLIKGLLQGVGFGVGMGNMTGGAGDEDCDCKNPASVDSLQQAVFVATPSQLAKKALIGTDTSNVATKLIDQPKAVNVNAVIDTPGLCKALVDAGFDNSWTVEQVNKIKETPSGQQRLKNINDKVVSITGLKEITHEQISQCFPGYIKTYECRASAPKAPKAQKAPGGGPEPHCHWDSIRKDLVESVSRHYSLPTNDAEKQKTLLLKTYISQRAELEFKNQINLFQNKTRDEWHKHMSDMKERSATGFQLEGTDYIIPWDLFEKYDVCFGHGKN